MSHILSGRNKPSLEFLMKVHGAFEEVELDWLIIGTTTPTLTRDNIDLPKSLSVESNQPKHIPAENPKTDKIENQKYASIPSEETSSPHEIIYLYKDGSFERFLPKK
jgi:hypothetical protein